MCRTKYLILVLLSISMLSGCVDPSSENPNIIEQSAEPSFVEANELIRVGYVIVNPLSISFVGTTEFQYDVSCFNPNTIEKNVEVPPTNQRPFFSEIRVDDFRGVECIGEKTITLILKDRTGTILNFVTTTVNIVE